MHTHARPTRAGVRAGVLVGVLLGAARPRRLLVLERRRQAGAITVTGTDTACTPQTTQVAAGTVAFRLENQGSRVNELYVLRPDGEHRRRARERRPRHLRGAAVDTARRLLHPAVQAGHDRRRHPDGDHRDRHGHATSDPRLGPAVTAYRGYVLAEAKRSLAGRAAAAGRRGRGDLAEAKALYATAASGGSGSNPSPSRSATSTRGSTCARRTSSPARRGPAGT